MNGQRKIQRRETLRAKTAGEIPKMFVQTSPEDYSLAALIILGTNHTKKLLPTGRSFVVGAARLERATACTPCKNASQLHHAPKFLRLQN